MYNVCIHIITHSIGIPIKILFSGHPVRPNGQSHPQMIFPSSCWVCMG